MEQSKAMHRKWNNGTIGTIVSCRMRSTRLPRKALLQIAGISAIERCLLNTLSSKKSQRTILATSVRPEDAILKDCTLNGRVSFFRGSEDDLVSRYIDAAEKFDISIIIRVTGDSPLISYELMDFLVSSHIRKKADFSYLKNAPLGIKPEVINKEALRKLKSLIPTNEYSEYLSLYFLNNPDFFKLNEVLAPEDYQNLNYRLVLDYPEDLKLLNIIFERLQVGKKSVEFRKVKDFLEKNPNLISINSAIIPKYKQGELADFLNKVTRIKTAEKRKR